MILVFCPVHSQRIRQSPVSREKGGKSVVRSNYKIEVREGIGGDALVQDKGVMAVATRFLFPKNHFQIL